MFTVYVLFSDKFKKIYIGQTCDMRIESLSITTDYRGTLKNLCLGVVHTEIFDSRKDELIGML